MSFLGKSSVLNLIKRCYTPASILFIIFFAWKNFPLLDNLIKSADSTRIFMAIALWCIAHLLSPLFSKAILSAIHQSIPYTKLLNIYATRLPARYIPGGIWHTVGRISDLHSEGITKKELTILVAAESTIPCLTTFVLGGGYLWFTATGGDFNFVFGLFFFACLIVLTLLPRLLAKTITFNELKLRNYFLSVLISILFWIVASSSFTLYFLSFPLSGSEISLFKIPAAYMFSWAIGFIAIFAPQGIGVFEFVAGNILNLPTTLSGTIVVLAGFRLVNLISDLIIWMSSRAFQILKKYR